MPNESSEIGSGFVKIFYSILLTLLICASMYAIVQPIIKSGGYIDLQINEVLQSIMIDINAAL